MDIGNWAAAGLATLGWIGAAFLFLPRLLSNFAERAVQHRLDRELEVFRAKFRADEELLKARLRKQDAELEALRAGALSAISSRRQLLDQRRIQAVEKLWAGVIGLGALRVLLSMTAPLRLEEMLKRVSGAEGEKLSEFAKGILESSGAQGHRYDPSPDLERPFLSAKSWALFDAYRQMLSYPSVILISIWHRMDANLLNGPDHINQALKLVSPEHADYIDKFSSGGYSYLADVIREKLVHSLVSDINGAEEIGGDLEQASEIMRKAGAMHEALDAKRLPTPPRGLEGLVRDKSELPRAPDL